MMLKKLAVTIAVLSTVVLIGCGGGGGKAFAPTKEGMVLTSHMRDGNGVKEGETRTTVRSVTRTDNKTEIVIDVRLVDADGSEQYDLRSAINIVNGIAEYDVASAWAASAPSRAEVKSADPLRIPSDMKPGDVLDDVTINVNMNRVAMTVMLRDVKCESVEVITIPAGKFNAHKITYTMSGTANGQQAFSMEVAEWYVKGIGSVQSVITEGGAVQMTTELVSIENR